MATIDLIRLLAIALWAHSIVQFAIWANVMRVTDKDNRVTMVLDLAFALIPAVVGIAAFVAAGTIFHFPSIVIFIAVMAPASIVVALRFETKRIAPATWRQEGVRWLGTALLTMAGAMLQGVI